MRIQVLVLFVFQFAFFLHQIHSYFFSTLNSRSSIGSEGNPLFFETVRTERFSQALRVTKRDWKVEADHVSSNFLPIINPKKAFLILTFATSFMQLLVFPLASVAADEVKTANIGRCVINSCRKELLSCLLNPKCFANLICIQSCTSETNETACQIKCGDLFENDVVGKFNACAVSQKKCVPQKQDDLSYPVPPEDSLVKTFDTSIFNGRWYISAGLNPIFDTFDCQVHFFVSPAPGQIYAKLNWRIKEPDGEFFTRDTVQRFVQDKNNPALLLNHDNEYLHYQDDWYILDAVPDNYILVYYRGRNDAWTGYGGAVLYTREKSVPVDIIPRLTRACDRARIKWTDFTLTDNSCRPETQDAALLRAEYTKKLLLLEGSKLAEQLTVLRGLASSEIQGSEVEVKNALAALEELREKYQTELEFNTLELTDIVGQELNELRAGAEYEAEFIEQKIGNVFEDGFMSGLNSKKWESKEKETVARLLEKIIS